MKTIVGTSPWLPGPLTRWKWLSEPIPAQRLAAWRIGTGLVLLLDLLLFYAPNLLSFYGPDSLGEPGIFAERFAWPYGNWSVLRWLPDSWGASVCCGIWVGSAVAIVLGWRPRSAALIAWALSLSFYNSNFYLHNSGDRIRHFLLLLLIFAPSDAAWSMRRWPRGIDGSAYVPPWPARLMFLQMTMMYFMNGLYKLQDPMWWDGSILHYVNRDLGWARWSAVPMPDWISRCLTWGALGWEAGFPLWVMYRRTRVPALIIGVVFHLLTFFHLELAAFPLYALCLYLPLVPWERLAKNRSV